MTKSWMALSMTVFGIVGCTNPTTEASRMSFEGTSTFIALRPAETLRFSKDDRRMQAKVLFTNTTNKPLRCVRAPGATGLGLMTEIVLLKGKPVESGFTKEVIQPFKADVFDLHPDTSIIHQFSVRELVGLNVRVGTYDLKLKYRVGPGSLYDTDYGLTVTEFEQTIPVIIE